MIQKQYVISKKIGTDNPLMKDLQKKLMNLGKLAKESNSKDMFFNLVFRAMEKNLTKILDEIDGLIQNKQPQTVYLHLLFRGMDKELALIILKVIRERLPQAVVTGITETIFDASIDEVHIKINTILFFQSEVKLLTIAECPADYKQLGQELSRKLAACPDAKAVAMYCSCLGTDFSILFRTLAQGNEDILFFGASAGIFENSAEIQQSSTNIFTINHDNYQEQQYIIGKDLLDVGIVMAVFCGKELNVHGDYILGWKPIGKELKVTKAIGINCLAELNGMPATEVYRHYLKVNPDEKFVFNISEFPLVVERNGCLIARVPPVYDHLGRIYFNGDIYEGEKMRLTYAVHAELLQETDQTSQKMCDFVPEGLFLTICGNRSLFLREAAHKELQFYQRFVPDAGVNYGTSELYHYKGQGGILNSALIVVAFREGDPIMPPSCNIQVTEEKDYVIPLAARMAAFLDVMAQELTESNNELKKMAQRAEAANQAKSNFLSNMSHEIRTPINAVLGMDEMILRECKDQIICEYAENIKAAGNNLLALINDILDFSKIEAGKLALIPNEYAISSILNDLVNLIANRAEQKGLQLIVKAPEDLPSVLMGDELRLRQVITNILTNAVKYTDNGSVTLSMGWEKCGEEEILLKVSVTDTGIGIKEEDLVKLFEVFERIEEERNRTIEGTGLGMNITQKLLGLMDSKLEVDSVYGEGSTFSFKVRQKVLNWDPMGSYEEAYRRIQQQQTDDGECFVAPEAKVLVVDDTVMNLTVISGLLKRTQIQIDTATSGYECLELAQNNKYDVIILDHRMPGMDGIETLAELRKMTDGANVNTPVVVLTANAVAGANEEYRAAGFDDYLTKPIDTKRLEACLLNFLPEHMVSYQKVAEQQDDDMVAIPGWIDAIPGIDIASGIDHCGGVKEYLNALTVFAGSLSVIANELEIYYNKKDFVNFTTKVHALKSTARVAGFAELSDRARRLEDAGNNGYINEIITDTPVLLNLCRDCANMLAPLLEQPDTNSSEKKPISSEELTEAWASLKEVVQSFDYDSLNYILDELSGYKLAEKDEESLQAIKAAAVNLDWERIHELLAKH